MANKTVKVELVGGSESFRRAFADAAKASGELGKSLDVVQKQIAGSLQGLTAGIGPLGNALGALGPAGLVAAAGIGAIGAGISGLVAFTAAATKGLVELGGHLSDLSAQTGLSTTTLQELRFAGSLVGVSLEDAAGAVGKMQKAVTEGDTVFARLGLNLGNLRKLDVAGQFDAVAAAIRAIKDPTQQAAAAMEAFGQGGVSLLPLIKSDTAAAREEFHRLGLEISEDTVAAADKLGDEATKLAAAWEGVKNQLAAGIVESGALTAVTEGLKAVMGGLATFLNDNKDLIRGFFALGLTAAKELAAFLPMIRTGFNGLVQVFALLHPGAVGVADDFKFLLQSAAQFQAFQERVAARDAKAKEPPKTKTFIGKGDEAAAAKAAAEAERARQKELAELRKADTAALKAADDATKLHAESVAKLAIAEGAAISPLQKKIAAINAERDALVSKAQADFVAFQNAASVSNITDEEAGRMEGLTNATIANANATRDAAVAQATFEENIARGNKAWDAYIKDIVDAEKATEEFARRAREASAEMAAGISSDFEALGGLLQDFGATAESVAVTFANSMAQAFAVVERSIKNGELSFADLAQSIGTVFQAGKKGGVGAGIFSGVGSGAAIGGLFGPQGALIGAGIGGIVGAIGGIFRSDPVKKAQQEAGRALGHGISREMAQQFLEEAKATGKSIAQVAKEWARKVKAEQDKANLDTLRAGVEVARAGAQDLLSLLDKFGPRAQAAGGALVKAVADAMAANGLGVLATGALAKSEKFGAVQQAVGASGQIFQGLRQAGGISTDLLANGGDFAEALRAEAVAAAKEAGLSDAEAQKAGLAAVAPLLRDQLEASIQSGQKLSAQTQQLIDEAKANGITIVADPMIALLDENKEQTALLRKIAGEGSGIGGDFEDRAGQAKGIPQFAGGSGGFRDFGAGTRADLHGVEGVFRPQDIPRLSDAMLSLGFAQGRNMEVSAHTGPGFGGTSLSMPVSITVIGANKSPQEIAREVAAMVRLGQVDLTRELDRKYSRP